MSKKKLENTKEIHFSYNPENVKRIILKKDDNETGKRYTEKGAYELIKTINRNYPNIIGSFEKKAEEKIRQYAKSKKKSLSAIDKIKSNQLEILADN